MFLLLSDFFQNKLFQKKIQEHYQSVKGLGSRSGSKRLSADGEFVASKVNLYHTEPNYCDGVRKC